VSEAKRRRVRVRCVRAYIDGQYGWLVRWLDYTQPPWRQQVFLQNETDARAMASKVGSLPQRTRA
jgi:hypothetical protein